MRHHRGVLLCVTAWCLLGLVGCSTDSMKSTSETPVTSPISPTGAGKDQPSSGEIQERAVPRPAPGMMAPPPASGATGQRPMTPPMGPLRAPGGMFVAPLTEAECTGLGGKVIQAAAGSDCTKLCATTDQNGVIHRVCITAQ